jgi:hypothetical protein
MGGVGMLYVSRQVATGTANFAELALPMSMLGTVAVALGVGFVLSAVIAYFISHRLGLFDSAPLTPHA